MSMRVLEADQQHRHRRKHAGSAARTTLQALGEIFLTLGVVVALYCGYELWFTGIYTGQQQAQLNHQLEQRWRTPNRQPPPAARRTHPKPAHSMLPGPIAAPPEGQALARLYIPALGRDYVKVIVQGVGHDDLEKGPGHYPGTAMPGQIGNFVVSGHRTTYGAPFNRLDELRRGDAVVIETDHEWYTYRVTGTTIVDPSDIAVTYPVPGRRGATPTRRLLTFTTCNPKYSAAQRLVLHGVLASAAPRLAGLPSALMGSR